MRGQYGVKVDLVPILPTGSVDLEALEELLVHTEEKALVSLMHINNEIGNMLDLDRVCALCQKHDALFHSDMVQSVGHFELDLKATPVDFIAASAHKFHGPKGVGFAYIRKNSGLRPLIFGGGQERGSRAGTESVHNIVGMERAFKLAYADLAYYVADPDYMNVSVDDMLSDRFILSRRAELNSGQASEQAEPGELVTKSDTIYLAAADKDGNMISFINSVSWEFGSGVVVPGTGFALQNRGTGFTLEEGMANTLAAGKRPFHTLVPAFVTRTGEDGNDEPWLSFGVMGGSMQPQGHIQVLLNLLVFEMDLQDALDAPRVRHISGLDVALEAPFSEVVRAGLRSLGHNLIPWNPHWFGGAQAVMKLERGWASASDPRKDGMAVGH